MGIFFTTGNALENTDSITSLTEDAFSTISFSIY
jgi:hypothetical protein